jgi:hypothetical protein
MLTTLLCAAPLWELTPAHAGGVTVGALMLCVPTNRLSSLKGAILFVRGTAQRRTAVL